MPHFDRALPSPSPRSFRQEEVFGDRIQIYPTGEYLNRTSYLRDSAVNLALGCCFTYEREAEGQRRAANTIDVIPFRPNPWISGAHLVFVHDRGRFLPVMGVGREYNGQFFINAQ